MNLNDFTKLRQKLEEQLKEMEQTVLKMKALAHESKSPDIQHLVLTQLYSRHFALNGLPALCEQIKEAELRERKSLLDQITKLSEGGDNY